MCKVTPHYREAHVVKGHYRQYGMSRVWISSHVRSGSFVNSHCKF